MIEERHAGLVHEGRFIGPMMEFTTCPHMIVLHSNGLIRTCLRCGHSLVG
jgi:hypothetical protein